MLIYRGARCRNSSDHGPEALSLREGKSSAAEGGGPRQSRDLELRPTAPRQACCISRTCIFANSFNINFLEIKSEKKQKFHKHCVVKCNVEGVREMG